MDELKIDYREKIKQLNKELLEVQTTDCKTKKFVWGTRNDRVVEFKMCKINGVSYVMCKDVCTTFAERRKTFINRELFSEDDFKFFVASRGQATTFVRADALYKVREEVTRLCTGRFDPQKPVIPVAEAAMKADVPNFVVDSRRLSRSQDAYFERIEALALAKEAESELTRQQMLKEAQEQKQIRLEEGKQEERTLRDLVQQIEDMGWHVTLELKNKNVLDFK